eukprot:NODE_272_length_12196_cov_0.228404.p8 type:complete len:184 gc:universal NODE_272_length_12196_cov_0.228404:1996-1445(-)
MFISFKYVGPTLLVAHFVVNNFCVIKINGTSMMPCLNHGDILLGFKSSNYRVGDVVMLEAPNGRLQVKRIVSLKHVLTDPNSVFGSQAIILNKGMVWVEGDSNSSSLDSNHYGPIPSSTIVAKVYARLWPYSPVLHTQSQRYIYRSTHSLLKVYHQYPWWYYYDHISLSNSANISIPESNSSL